MKLFIFGATLATLAAVTPVGAQGRNGNLGVPPGQMPPAGMCRVWIDGVPPGRQPRPTDCVTARANVPRNGRLIYGGNQTNSRDCTYSRSNNSVGDIIFGRSGNNTTNCVDNNNNRVNGAWYPVSRDRSEAIYERQTRDANGNLIIQRARRDRNGNLSVISTRNAGRNGSYNNSRYNNGTYNNGTYNNRTYNNGVYNNRPADTRRYDVKKVDDRSDANADDRDNGHGKGNDKAKGHDKDKDHDKDKGHDKG